MKVIGKYFIHEFRRMSPWVRFKRTVWEKKINWFPITCHGVQPTQYTDENNYKDA